MKILIYDKIQDADNVPESIKTPALSDVYNDDISFNADGLQDKAEYTMTFDGDDAIFDNKYLWGIEDLEGALINCIGIGYTDANAITISNGTDERGIIITEENQYMNGLYLIDDLYTLVGNSYSLEISHNGTYIGRVAIGEYRELGTNPTKEIGFYTTTQNRKTMSGQTIPGAGGYSGRRFEADVRYKIDSDVYDDIENAYNTSIMRAFPYFMLLDCEQHKLPYNMYRFYASTDKPLSLLQSASYKFLYSYKFSFYEAF